MKFSKKDAFNLPNILTYIRLLCVPFFIWMMFGKDIVPGKYGYIYAAFAIFLFATITDIADGYIARKFNLVSDIGKVVDPIADKLLQVSTLLCLTIQGHIHYAFPIIFFIKELYMVLGGVVILKGFKSKYIIQSNIFGKVATWLNSIGIVMAFFVPLAPPAYWIAITVILALASGFAIVTAGAYTLEFFKFHRAELSGTVETDIADDSDDDIDDEDGEADARVDS